MSAVSFAHFVYAVEMDRLFIQKFAESEPFTTVGEKALAVSKCKLNDIPKI